MKIKHYILTSSICLMALSPVIAAPQNLIVNGNFDQIKDGKAINWSASETPNLSQANYPSEGDHGNMAQMQLQRTGDKGAYFAQSITVKPHTKYRLSLLAKMDEGKITIAVTGAAGKDKLNERLLGMAHTRLTMFPLFWNEKFSKYLVFNANKWRPVTLDFDSGNLTKVYISFGAYFTAGTYSFDDVTLEEISE